MKIAIDMDNTLIDELGSTKRPGIEYFLETISQKNELHLLTNSTKARALEIMKYNDLRKYFVDVIAREDYDPEGKGIYKDLRKYDFDILIDDDPEEIQIIGVGATASNSVYPQTRTSCAGLRSARSAYASHASLRHIVQWRSLLRKSLLPTAQRRIHPGR
ncbi:NIF family HAD-type phosphatase [Breznakiella homolactica]|uniref:FCP1 homology domain-containing protein n=1 Tax=Breznakiella homolactica TaxID=2798577 RepID=A0A7T7XQ08_9SPIR|nr:NIF family HAD-type phosphatase [Breznakiella homolactica]QQO10362.1 HAD family hydrolase [Breznakiella homolactica]